MKKVFLAIAALIFCLTCETYQTGVTYEDQNRYGSLGFFLGSTGEYYENSFLFFPQTSDKSMAIGYDLNIKVPFNFLKDQISIYPMAGFESRYFENFGLGVKFGGGFDYSFHPTFFIRGTGLYQPELTTFMDGYPGIRLNASFGYRTSDDPIRRRLERAKRERENEQRQQARRQEELRREEDRVQALYNAVANNPNDPKAHYDLGMYYNSNGRTVLAANSIERVLQLDPAYRYEVSTNITSTQAASIGIQTSSNLTINNYSLNYFYAGLLFNAANNTGNDPEKTIPASERQNTYEKALTAYRRGFEIDITNRRNTNNNLNAAYLGNIARIQDLLGRTTEANSTYTELSKIATLIYTIARRIGIYTGYNNVNDLVFSIENFPDGSKYIEIKGYKGIAVNVIIPEYIDNIEVLAIGVLAFGTTHSETRIQTVVIPDSIMIIYDGGFARNEITNVQFGNGLEVIGRLAFSLNKLTTVIIPDSVTEIGSQAFDGNPLTSITIPNQIKIERNSFPGSFYSDYTNSGRIGGTYRLVNNRWIYQ